MRIALVYDRINKFGGAERVLLALHEIWPRAPLYTSVYNEKSAPWAKVFDVRPSFMQKIPFAKSHHELYPWLTPLAFEQFDFSEYDIVISVSSAEAKNIITTPKTLHLCYCLTPTRYLWSGNNLYPKSFLRSLLSVKLRMTDQIASQRPDKYIAISKTVAQRIQKYYCRESEIIYPPIDTEKFLLSKKTEDFFLLVSRLVPYKKVDLAITAFNKLGKKLVIIGSGSEENHLKRIAGKNIMFLKNLTEEKLLSYYQSCRALIFPSIEDFGLVSLEAQTCGKPVIANFRGGAKETLIDNKTGLLFENSAEKLIEAVKKFENLIFDPETCRSNALKYDKKVFKKAFKETVERIYGKKQS